MNNYYVVLNIFSIVANRLCKPFSKDLLAGETRQLRTLIKEVRKSSFYNWLCQEL